MKHRSLRLRLRRELETNPRLAAAAYAAALGALIFGFSFLLKPLTQPPPAVLSKGIVDLGWRPRPDESPRALGRLRRAAEGIKAEFGDVLSRQEALLAQLMTAPVPEGTKDRFGRLQALGLDTDIEGASFSAASGKPEVWLGVALGLEDVAAPGGPGPPERSARLRLVKSKASTYLVLVRRLEGGELAAVFRLLAFVPQFKSPTIQEYQFLPPGLAPNAALEYFDYREDVTGMERFFARNNDELVGQPLLQGRIQSLFFPLRDPHRRIVGTVNLKSPPPEAVLQARRDALRLAGVAFLLLALLVVAVDLGLRFFMRKKPTASAWALSLAVLAGIRLLVSPLGRFQATVGFPSLSPDSAGFRSLAGLTKSPADMLATSAVFFLGLLATAVFLHRRPARAAPRSPLRQGLAAVLTLAAAIALYPAFLALTGVLVRNSNINLLEFPFQGAFLLLQLSLLLVWAGLLLAQALAFRRFFLASWRPVPVIAVFVALEIAAFAWRGARSPILFLLQALAVGSLLWASRLSPVRLNRAGVLVALLAQVIFLYGGQAEATAAKVRVLAGRFVKNNVLSLEPWARFVLAESLPELDRGAKTILESFRRPEAGRNLARELWDKTLLAKFNWYSSLEIIKPDGEFLSRFSLNIPKFFRPSAAPAAGAPWTILRVRVPFMGKEREFLTAEKDWSADGEFVGRTVLSLSLDPDMLPFLYSANPYFELLRVNTIPSLSGFDIRFAVFDRDGLFLFNPYKLSTGLPASLRNPSPPDAEGRWMTLQDKGRGFDLFAFSTESRVYAIFVPRRSWRAHCVGVIKLALLYGAALGFPLLAAAFAAARRKRRTAMWSFANRVFLSFLIVAVIPLLLFAVFSRNYFGRLFSQQFVEKAEIHADLARGVMDDFLSLQPEEAAPISPPEELVLLLSNTISNDVNLYRDGRLVASSRREFFDAGIFADLLDGEAYEKLRVENTPYVAQERRIGSFTLRTLTVPYTGFGAHYFLSLPFPFERRDIANATQELIEFLVFISVFFIAVVLLLARWIGSRIITPVRRLLAGTREVSLGNLEIAIDYDRRDEMKTLVDGFNTMIRSLKQHQQELSDLGKKAAWAEMARKVAHEIKNPLTPIQLSAEHILRVFEDRRGDFEAALRESISYIVGEVENLRRIAQEFLEISRDPLVRRESFSLEDLVRETVEPYRKLLAERIAIRDDYEGEDFTLTGDRAKLKIALRNLLTNAIESIHGRGEIRTRLAGGPDELVLDLEDSGEGMDKDVLDRVFEPYFSTKDAGTGLGLPIAKKIVEDHGGTIQLASGPGRGTSIKIRLPRQRA